MTITKIKTINEADVRRIVDKRIELNLKRLKDREGILLDAINRYLARIDKHVVDYVPDDWSVKNMELSCRGASVLHNSNINTAGELRATTEARLLKCRNFGHRSLTELKIAAQIHGITIGSKYVGS